MPAEVETAVFALTPAWHGIGVVLEDAPTAEIALEKGGLGWTVSKHNIQANYVSPNEEITALEIPDRMAVVRDDTQKVLGVVGPQYTPLQNNEAFEAMATVMEREGIVYESAGVLRNGQQIWLLARCPESYEIVKDDKITPYILLTNAHDGSKSVKFLPTNVRVVCANTLALALRKGGAFTVNIRHTARLYERIDNAAKVFDKYRLVNANNVEMLRQLVDKESDDIITEGIINRVLDNLIPFPTSGDDKVISDIRIARRLEAAQQIRANLVNERQLPIKGTAYALLNAVTEYVDHQANHQRGPERDRQERKFESLIYGPKADLKLDVLHSLKDYYRIAA